ncbi:hypothetical protein [Prauserella flavalba]
MIGLVYDPARDPDFRIDTAARRASVDVLVHAPQISPVTLLRGGT